MVGAGKNAFPLMTYNGTTVDWYATGANFEDTKKIYKVARCRPIRLYEGRTEVVREMTLDAFKKEPDGMLDDREKN